MLSCFPSLLYFPTRPRCFSSMTLRFPFAISIINYSGLPFVPPSLIQDHIHFPSCVGRTTYMYLFLFAQFSCYVERRHVLFLALIHCAPFFFPHSTFLHHHASLPHAPSRLNQYCTVHHATWSNIVGLHERNYVVLFPRHSVIYYK